MAVAVAEALAAMAVAVVSGRAEREQWADSGQEHEHHLPRCSLLRRRNGLLRRL